MRSKIFGATLAAASAGALLLGPAAMASAATPGPAQPMSEQWGSWAPPGPPPGPQQGDWGGYNNPGWADPNDPYNDDWHCDRHGNWHNDERDQWGHQDGRCHNW